MKVLHLIGGGDVGGAKSHVLSLVKELNKHIDVKLICFRTGPFFDEATAMGINIDVIKTYNIFNDINKVLKLVKEGDYNLIHSHGAKANMISVIIKQFINIPTITTVHSDYRLDYIDNILKKYSYGLINTWALRLIDYYIGVSTNFKKMLISRNFNPNNTFTLYNGIDFNAELESYSKSAFIEKHSLDISEETILVGILARLHPIKGIDIFLKAAKIVLEKSPSVHFVIGGTGEEKKYLEKLASSLGMRKNVHFLGFIEDPYEFMSSIDIKILSSLSESFPYVILEAARLKNPVISSNVGGISDLIDDKINGFLFEPGDYNKLSNLILTLVNNLSTRTQMGELIYEKAKQYFSLQHMCKTQLDIYEKVATLHKLASSDIYKYDVIISGYYGFKNIGDEAMLEAIIENIRNFKENVRILVLSKTPKETKMNYGIHSINRLNLLKIIKSLRKSKLFISGGGNLIQDNTSSRSLMYYLTIIMLAKLMGNKVMLYANGIGPLIKNNDRKLSSKILNNVDMITVREPLSKAELNLLNITKPQILLTADPALTIKPVSEVEAKNILMDEGIELSKPIIGLSIRKWHKWQEYCDTLAKSVDYMVKKYDVTPVFIPMHYPNDHKISEYILSKMDCPGYVLKGKYSISEILGLISCVDLLISMRLHGLIFALSEKIPSIGLVYESKVKGFLDYTQQPSAGNVESLELENLISIMEHTWTSKEQIRLSLESKSLELKEKALSNAKFAVDLLNN